MIHDFTTKLDQREAGSSVAAGFRHRGAPSSQCLTSSSWLWTCWTIRSMATMFPPPEEEPCALVGEVAHLQS